MRAPDPATCGTTPRTRTRANPRRRAEEGFTLVEVLVSGVVLVIGLVFSAQFLASAVGRVADADVRSLLHQVASEEIENIRALPYEDVGTTTGHPRGVLLAHEQRTVDGVTLDITREVIFVRDASYSGPYPANYRRVTVRVAVAGQSRLQPVEMTTIVAGGAAGGSLDVTVTDYKGDPVPDAQITVTNTHLVPNVNIDSSAIHTDSQGHILIPGLTPDPTPSYLVTATKPGYNSAATDPPVVVQDGTPYTVVQLIIDRLATLVVHVVDGQGTPVPGLSLSITGPRGFDRTVTSDQAGTATLADIGYSTSLDPYVVLVVPDQGYAPASASVVLDPGQTQDVTIVVSTGGATTTTVAATTTTLGGTTTTTLGGTTTTTIAPTTTTIPASGSLTVRVMYWKDGRLKPLKDTEVNLNGDKKKTNDQGYVTYTDLALGTYPLQISKNGYRTYQQTVTIDGAVYLEVTLEKN